MRVRRDFQEGRRVWDALARICAVLLLTLALVVPASGMRPSAASADPVLQQLSQAIGQAVSLCDHGTPDGSGPNQRIPDCNLCALCSAVGSLTPAAPLGVEEVRFARPATFRPVFRFPTRVAHLAPRDGRPRAPPVSI